MPLGDPSMKAPAAIMYNILGEDEVVDSIFFCVHLSLHFGLY
jgi:phosphoribosylaminoimidazole carboxylase